MPWRCPACEVQIRHSDFEDRPRPTAFYRCHICRLELVLDSKTDKLTVAPLSGDEDTLKKRKDPSRRR